MIKQKYKNTNFWILTGFVVIGIFFGGFGVWAAVASISGAIVAQGVVAVETKIKTIQHLTGGVIAAIHVSNGQFVKTGDPLITLDEALIKANLAISTREYYELLARKGRLEAERDNRPKVVFPSRLTKHKTDPEVVKIFKEEISLFEARRLNLRGQARLLRKKGVQFKQQIKGLRFQYRAKKEQNKLIIGELVSIKELAEKGLITKKRLLILQREAASIKGELGRLISEIARVQGMVEEVQLKILQSTMGFREAVITELRKAQPQVQMTEARVMMLRDKLRHAKVRAPQSGRIHNMSVHTIGGVISPAAAIMQIVPEGDKLIAEVKVNPLDIDKISPGQVAALRFPAFSSRSTPELDGKVIKISADRVMDKSTGVAYFIVNVSISDEQLARMGTKKIITGMPVDVFFKTHSRTVMNYILKPLADQLQRAFRE